MTNHGGKREGAGRPKEKVRKVRVTLSLHPFTLKTIRRMGYENKSAAADLAFIAYAEKMVDMGIWKPGWMNDAPD